jgi:hypothetical protein
MDWYIRFEQLEEYKEANGDCKVPQRYSKNMELGRWVAIQRHKKKTFELSEEREAKLSLIGFAWNIRCLADWDVLFQQLLIYKEAVGDCNVPQEFRPNPHLGHWVSVQRRAKKKERLSKERLEKLNSIGFDWKGRCMAKSRRRVRQKGAWDTRFEQLEEYKEANGDCKVPQRYSKNMELGRWVAIQRHKKKTSQLSDEREAKLKSIEFVWNINEQADWNVRFQQLLEYKVNVGDCNFPQLSSRNPQLGRWVLQQRCNNKMLTKEHWLKLNSIRFDWGKQASSRPSQLGKWVTEQRFNTKKAVLEKEGVVQLNLNDKCTNKNEISWDAFFRELLSYLQAHGDHSVPQGYPRNPLLARWVNEQRNDYDLKLRGEQTSLTPLREAKLDAIGFTWFVRGTIKEDTPPGGGVCSSAVQPEEARSGSKVRSENVGVLANPDSVSS